MLCAAWCAAWRGWPCQPFEYFGYETGGVVDELLHRGSSSERPALGGCRSSSVTPRPARRRWRRASLHGDDAGSSVPRLLSPVTTGALPGHPVPGGIGRALAAVAAAARRRPRSVHRRERVDRGCHGVEQRLSPGWRRRGHHALDGERPMATSSSRSTVAQPSTSGRPHERRAPDRPGSRPRCWSTSCAPMRKRRSKTESSRPIAPSTGAEPRGERHSSRRLLPRHRGPSSTVRRDRDVAHRADDSLDFWTPYDASCADDITITPPRANRALGCLRGRHRGPPARCTPRVRRGAVRQHADLRRAGIAQPDTTRTALVMTLVFGVPLTVTTVARRTQTRPADRCASPRSRAPRPAAPPAAPGPVHRCPAPASCGRRCRRPVRRGSGGIGGTRERSRMARTRPRRTAPSRPGPSRR